MPAALRVLPLPGRPPLPIPSYATPGSAGLDLPAAEALTIPSGEWAAVSTGIAVELDSGFEGQIRPRSGLAARAGVTVLNAPGTIDSDYRGEVKVLLVNHGKAPFEVEIGDRVAQMVIAPVTRVEVELVTSVQMTDRGSGGFGHTGR